MSNLLIYALGATFLIIIIIIGLVLILRKNKIKTPSYDVSSIAAIFNKENIITFEYIRNKMVVLFKDLSLFNANELKELGAKNISISGDKIKFYIEEDAEKNKVIFEKLKETIERS